MNESDENLRIIVLDISKQYAANVYDEAIVPVEHATEFVEKYIDMAKYRVVTV